MFEVGFSEIVLILGLALLVLGPEKLPGLAEKVGRWTGRARSMARQLRTQLEQEVTLEELSKSRPAQTPPPPPAEPESETTTTPAESVDAAPPDDQRGHEFDLDAFATTDTSAPSPQPLPGNNEPTAQQTNNVADNKAVQ
jgi:sec-independent protein translocase protein TatB